MTEFKSRVSTTTQICNCGKARQRTKPKPASMSSTMMGRRRSRSRAACVLLLVALTENMYDNVHRLRSQTYRATRALPLQAYPQELLVRSPEAQPLSPRPWKPEGLLNDSCTYVEDICHTSNRWIYRTTASAEKNVSKHQPRVLLKMRHVAFKDAATPYCSVYEFETPIDVSATDHCTESPVTNHLVLFSLYSDMLGEFYVRGLLFLWALSRQVDWLPQAQLYLHSYNPFRTLMDSHHLFTSPFRGTHRLLDFSSLLDETLCTCLPRLILCGYESSPIMINVTAEAPANQSVGGDDDAEEVILLKPDGGRLSLPSDAGSLHFRDFRNSLYQTMIQDNPHVQDDIQSYRTQILAANNVPVNASEQNDWRIVGLAQRNGRRKWLELEDVIQRIQGPLKGRNIVVVEANVEDKTSSFYQQLARHGALDALIGIHGALLTEAIWMKPNSWVVELLPYIPDGIGMGAWTKQTDQPTPLGIIFDNTNLNHVGYPLQRHSAPYCYHDNGTDIADLDCWSYYNSPWDDRNFKLDSSTVESALISYIAQSHSFDVCDDFVNQAEPRNLVLYNVNCADETNASVVPHHYYRAMPSALQQ